MAINQYFDESKIIKKNNKKEESQPVVEKEQQAEEPKIEITEEEEQPEVVEKEEVNEEVIEEKDLVTEIINNNEKVVEQSLNDKAQEYINAVKDFNKEAEKEKPMYNVSRDEDGEVKMTPVNKKNNKKNKQVLTTEILRENVQKEVSELIEQCDEKDIFAEQLQKIREENERRLQSTRIEILLNKKILETEIVEANKTLYNSKLEMLMKDLQMLNKRKTVLEDETIWQRD